MAYVKLAAALCAASAVIVLISAAPASAAGGTTLCKVNETPCSALNHYEAGTKFRAVAKGGITLTRTGVLFEEQIRCGRSEIEGKSTSTGSNSTDVAFGIGLVAFNECLLFVQGQSRGACTNSELTPLPGATIADTPGTMDGTFTTGEFQLTSICENTMTSCTFTASSVSLELDGGEPASLVASSEELKGPGTGCPKALDWSATYTFVEPTTPLWLAQSL